MLDLFDAAGDLSAAIEALHAATALYTAEPVVDVLLDRIGRPDRDGRLVDPSAGDGMFMVRALSGASGKSCGPRQEGNAGRAARPMPTAFAPDEGMAVCIPVDRGVVDRLGDLVPALEAPTR
jgi:hypothetical protein